MFVEDEKRSEVVNYMLERGGGEIGYRATRRELNKLGIPDEEINSMIIEGSLAFGDTYFELTPKAVDYYLDFERVESDNPKTLEGWFSKLSIPAEVKSMSGRNLGYAALCAGLFGIGALGGSVADRYLAVRPLQEQLAVQESNSREIRERLGRCYSDDRRGYIVNPDMTATIWDISGDRRIRLSEIHR